MHTLKHECLNHFVVLGERHLIHLVDEFVDYYHQARPHQGLRNETPMRARDGLAPGRSDATLDSAEC